MPGRKVRARAGVAWVGDGWRLFRQAKLMWIVILVLLFLVHVGLGMVPFVGLWLPNLVSPILAGGITLGCRSLETGGELELEHLLAGFRRNTGILFAIGLLYTAGGVAIMGAFIAVAGSELSWAYFRGDETAILEALPDDPMRFALAGLVAAAIAVPLMAAYWFAPALAMMHDVPAIPAMKESFFASFRNFVPMLVYGLVMTALAIAAVIPLGLGFLVWVPLLIASTYASYRSVFTEEDGEAG
jgi:hypothetical protein